MTVRSSLETIAIGWMPAWIGYAAGYKHGEAAALRRMAVAMADQDPTTKQIAFIVRLCREKSEDLPDFEGMTRAEASLLIDDLKCGKNSDPSTHRRSIR